MQSFAVLYLHLGIYAASDFSHSCEKSHEGLTFRETGKCKRRLEEDTCASNQVSTGFSLGSCNERYYWQSSLRWRALPACVPALCDASPEGRMQPMRYCSPVTVPMMVCQAPPMQFLTRLPPRRTILQDKKDKRDDRRYGAKNTRPEQQNNSKTTTKQQSPLAMPSHRKLKGDMLPLNTHTTVVPYHTIPYHTIPYMGHEKRREESTTADSSRRR